MRHLLFILLATGLPAHAAAAQVAATRYQLPGADCALFPAEKLIYDIAGKDDIAEDSITGQQVDSIENLLLMLLRNRAASSRFCGKERYYKKFLRPLPKSLKKYRRQYFGFIMAGINLVYISISTIPKALISGLSILIDY